ncbi:MAG: right-handed parallel beta-helix repeat-containing protein [Rubrivivax sp.]
MTVLTLLPLLLLSACGGGGAGSELAAAAAPAIPNEGATAVRGDAAAEGLLSGGVYIDAVNGSDGNAGTMAAPWKTLGKLASTAVVAGQNVYLSCSSVWRESVTLRNSNLVAGSKILGYGNCSTNKPRISGADDFSSGWTRSGNVWSRSVPAGTPKIARLFIGSDAQRVAQWPNFGGFGAEYAKSDSTSAASRMALRVATADRSALTGKSIAGATIHVRSDPWFIDTQTVSAWDAGTGTLTLAGNTTYTMEAGNGYVLQDQAWMLDAPGEFFHDTAANKLYAYPSSAAAQADLNSVGVEGSVRDTALAIVGIGNISLQGLNIGRARKIGLSIEDSPGAIVGNGEISGNGDTGLRLVLRTALPAGAVSATVSNNRINDNWRFGIDSTYAAGVTIGSNIVDNTGTLGHAGGSSAAIKVGDGGRVLSNRVRRAAYLGISFSGAGGTRVAGNLISEYCQRLTDCAAIYTWNGSTAPIASTGMNSLVEQNRILAAVPNTEGAVGGGFDLVSGIYLDNFTRGTTLRENIIAEVPYGMVVHNSSNNLLERNSVWLSRVAAIKMSMDIAGGSDWMTGNQIGANTLVPALTAAGTYPAMPGLGQSLAVQFSNVVSGSGTLSSASNLFSGNNIVALNDAAVVFATVSGGSAATMLDFTGWKQLNPVDGAVLTPALFALYQLNLGSELINGGGFDLGLGDWTSWFAGGSGSGSVVAAAMAGCGGTCAVMTASTVNDSLMSPAFNLAVGVPHRVTFSASLATAGNIATPYVGRTSPLTGSVVAAPGFSSTTSRSGAAGSTIQYEGFFVAASSDTARLNLKVASAGTAVGFDRVSLKPVLGYSLAKVAEYAVAVHAENGSTLPLACADLGWPAGCVVKDLNGAAVAMPLTLAAGQSALLLRANAPWAR